jgi:UDP-MurNAc hydroxylase
MKLINFGGATAVLEHKGVRMMFDPWLDDGIFHGSWHHYPPLDLAISDVGRLDYIYISHIHEDHCSAGTLRHLDKNATLLVMDRKPNFVLDFLERNDRFGFSGIKLVQARSPVVLQDGLVADIIEADPSDEMAFIIDSALVLDWDGYIILNANDCLPYQGMIDYVISKYGSPSLALLPYAGGSGYPSCYLNLSEKQKQAECSRIRNQRTEVFVDSVRQLNPVRAMPFADQYAVVGSRGALNKYIGHPPSPAAVRGAMHDAGLIDKLILLRSGQEYDLEMDRMYPEIDYPEFSEEDRLEYVRAHSTELYDHEKLQLSPSVPLERLARHARSRLWTQQVRRNSYPDMNLYLEVSDEQTGFLIDLRSDSLEMIRGTRPELLQPYLRIAASRTLLAMLLIGHVSWNVADASLFLDYERVPNNYDPEIYVLLNFLKV